MVHFAVCFDMNGYYSIYIWITDYLMEALKNFETYQIFRFSENQRVDNNFFMVYTIFYVKSLAG